MITKHYTPDLSYPHLSKWTQTALLHPINVTCKFVSIISTISTFSEVFAAGICSFCLCLFIFPTKVVSSNPAQVLDTTKITLCDKVCQ